MVDWHQVRERFNLRLTEEQLQRIRQKLPPAPEPGMLYADGVFEGGGVLGTAFLGAARCCNEVGIRWKGLAGTSAGAITAALLASDLAIDELETLLGSLDFMSFLSEKSSRFIWNGDPSKDLENPARMLVNLWLFHELGEYSTGPFREWLNSALVQGRVERFGDIGGTDPDRQLKVVVSDLTNGEMRVLPDDLEKYPTTGPAAQFQVADAVRLSMSIPFFFEPGQLGDAVIVDGGILSNFPLWIYDEPDPKKPPAWPTFGFRLADRRTEGAAIITSPLKMLGAMLRTMMYASDRHYLSEHNKNRVIDIDITDSGVTTTKFNLTDEEKADLYRRGYEATRQFLLDRWSWQEHLRTRGFGPG
jgi:NTE family protein